MASVDNTAAGPSTPAHRSCPVCGSTEVPGTRNGVIPCRACKEFFRRQSLSSQPTAPCPRSGNCSQLRSGRTYCAPCRTRRCFEIGMSADTGPSSQDSTEDDEPLCHTCNRVNTRKRTLTCSQCDRIHLHWHHTNPGRPAPCMALRLLPPHSPSARRSSGNSHGERASTR